MATKLSVAELSKVLSNHKLWLAGDGSGARADLSSADLRSADLRSADLRYADLRYADLRYADLSSADLRYADLRYADLSSADLSSANLSSADLSSANLSSANLRSANLRSANLRYADLSSADLSSTTGIQSARAFISSFDSDASGIIVYKAIGGTDYSAPARWKILPGAVLEEVVNPLPTVDCGCGVNFGTRTWVERSYPNSALWRCRIDWCDLADIVVPYASDGKARCARLTLLERIK